MINNYGSTLDKPGLRNSFVISSPIDGNIHDYDIEIKKLMRAHGVYNKRENHVMYNKFVRFPGVDPYNALTVTKEYVFFTKPDLHLININTGNVASSLSNYAFFNDAVERYRPVCEQLQLSTSRLSGQYTHTDTKNPFITLLSNNLQSELELPSLESSNDLETGANVYGTKITYRGSSYTSDQDLNFSLQFEDTKFLEIYMFFKIYDEYCKLKNLGMIELAPPPKNNNSKNASTYDDDIWVNYTINKILHDQFSVYKFVVGEDGMTLIYWAKYTGVYPTGAPRDAFGSMNNQNGQSLTVNFKAQFIRDMDPAILGEFNSIALNNKTGALDKNNLPLFDSKNHMMNGEWSSMPYIGVVKPSGYDKTYQGRIEQLMKYRLLWKE